MLNQLIDQAIQAALIKDWLAAIEINLEILDKHPYHIPSLNRLAKAYLQTGDCDQAQETYHQVLDIDPYNDIAKKNLLIISHQLKSKSAIHDQTICTDFIDEPGVTKTIPLVRLGEPQLISSLRPGQIATLVCNSHLVCITTQNQEHIGALTDDMAFYLREYIRAGNTYQVVIKSASPKSVLIYLREQNRAEAHKDTPSFANY
jgi:tetratricopeptide (TPR) repeat protein